MLNFGCVQRPTIFRVCCRGPKSYRGPALRVLPEPSPARQNFKNNMAGTEDPSSPDEDSEWSDFSSNSSKLNAFDNLPFGTKSLDPISVLSTLIACFPLPSDSTGESSASVADDR